MSGASGSARESIAPIAAALETVATHLATGGMLLGADRVYGRAQWGYGDDRDVGFAVAVENSGAPPVHAVTLLGLPRRSSPAGVIPQLLGDEYLFLTFATDLQHAPRT